MYIRSFMYFRYMNSKYNNESNKNIRGGENLYEKEKNTFLSEFSILSKKLILLNTRSYH